jgi:replicative DNA helicase
VAKKPFSKNNQGPTVSADIIGAPLYSSEAEKAVLGSMISHPQEVNYKVMEVGIKRSDFFVPAHQEIFEAILNLDAKGQPIDIPILHQYFEDRKLSEIVGSPGILAELVAGVATHLNTESYVRIVKGKSVLRQLQSACQSIAQDIADRPDEVEAVLDQAESYVFAVNSEADTKSAVTIRDEIKRTLEQIARYRTMKGKMTGIPTGFFKLNGLTGGWQPTDMIVLAARPGAGKTALALTFAKAAMKERYSEEKDDWIKPGFGVGFFSLEMGNNQIMLRLLSSYAGIGLKKIRTGDLEDHEMDHITLMSEEMRELPMYMDDSSMLTINQLRAKARRMKKQFKIDMIMVDYLQLLRAESVQARDSRQNEVAEISRGIKALAKELHVPILVLAQLNRKAEEAKQEPGLHNLRESGAIEQDADIVMLLHREEQEVDPAAAGNPRPEMRPYKLIIAKHRNGPTDSIDVVFNGACTRFEDPNRHEG